MDNRCHDYEEPHYSSIKSICSDSRTGSDDKLTGTRGRDQNMRRSRVSSLCDTHTHQGATSTPAASTVLNYNSVDIHVLSRSIHALNVSHGRHLATSFPDHIVSGHDDCLCCNRGRKWVCWRMEINKQLADSVLNRIHHNGGLRTWRLSDRPRDCDMAAFKEDLDTLGGGGSYLPSHHYFMYGIPRARLHDRLRQ